jgi:DNA invertase Pin-like site-specific DNA recombinase
MPLAAYARCSTPDQRLDPQIDALRAYAQRRGAELVEFTDAGVSGRNDRRPGLDAMMAAISRREVNAVVITKLDRLARSTRHLCALSDEFKALGVDLIVLDQAIDTSTPSGKLLFDVLAAVAEFEHGLIRERTLAGLAAARRRGKKLGRPKAHRQAKLLARVRRLRRAGRSLAEVGRVLGVSKSMAAKLAREARV